MILSLISVLTLQAFAAISTNSALEVLTLPQESRLLTAQQKGADMYQSLVKVAFSDEHSIPMRWKALTLASEMNPSGAGADLEKALRSKDWFMRNAALTAIKTTRPELIKDVVPKLIQDKALVVRSAAVSILDPKLEPQMRQLLWKELNAEYNFRKGQSLWVRGQIVEKLSFEPLKKEYVAFGVALRSADTTLHIPAILALEKLTSKKLATAKSSINEKRSAWLDYIRANPNL